MGDALVDWIVSVTVHRAAEVPKGRLGSCVRSKSSLTKVLYYSQNLNLSSKSRFKSQIQLITRRHLVPNHAHLAELLFCEDHSRYGWQKGQARLQAASQVVIQRIMKIFVGRSSISAKLYMLWYWFMPFISVIAVSHCVSSLAVLSGDIHSQ